jgi:hypothetical protein
VALSLCGALRLECSANGLEAPGERKFGQTQSNPADYCRSPQADRRASASAGRGAFEPLPPGGSLRGIARKRLQGALQNP